jgi:hypothetical protein
MQKDSSSHRAVGAHHAALPLSSQQKEFSWHVKASAQIALRHFHAHAIEELRTPTEQSPRAHALRNHLREEYDWRNDTFSVKGTIDDLMIDQALYLELAEQTHDVDALYRAMEAIALAQIETLTFETNDYPRAALRRDQFAQTLHAVVDHLRSEQLLAENDTRFDDLVNGYNCALSGYLDLREKIMERTKGEYSSLIEWVCDDIAAKATPDTADGEEAAAGHLLARRYRALFREMGLDTKKKGFFPPSYAHIVAIGQHAAMREARNALPYETDRATIEQRSHAPMARHMQALADMHLDLSSIAEASRAERYMWRAYAAAYQQPEDLDALAEQAGAVAQERTQAAFARLYRTAERDRQSLICEGEKKLQTEGLLPYPPQIVERLIAHWYPLIQEEIKASDNIHEMLEQFEIDADAVLHETTCALEHPVMIQLRRCYAEAYGKELLQALRARNTAEHAGYDVNALKHGLDAVLHKYDMAYDAHWETANWCLKLTNGAYADFGQYALAMEMTAKAKDYSELSLEERMYVPKIANHYRTQCGVDRHIPEAWAAHPMMPALYRQSMDYVVTQLNRAMQQDYGVFSDKVGPKTVLDAAQRQQIVAASEAAREQIDARMPGVLANAVASFAPEAPDADGLPAEKAARPQLATPYMDAKTLQQLSAFFAEERQGGRVQ